MGMWYDNETDVLINELTLRKHLFLGQVRMPNNFWNDISNALWLRGVNRSPESCRLRKRSLERFLKKLGPSNLVGNVPWIFAERVRVLLGEECNVAQRDAPEIPSGHLENVVRETGNPQTLNQPGAADNTQVEQVRLNEGQNRGLDVADADFAVPLGK